MAYAPFGELERFGIVAEQVMMRATGGVNMHRGAIFTLRLLCAAEGAAAQDGERPISMIVRAALMRNGGKRY